MKQFFGALKEAWKDKKKRAFISLGLWFLFFILVIACSGRASSDMYSGDARNNENKKSNLVSDGSSVDKFKNTKNYEYESTIEIVLNNKTYNYGIKGTFYDNKYYFSYNNINYFINNNKIYVVDELNKTLTLYKDSNPNSIFNLYNILFMTKDSLHNIIINSEEYNKTTYKDGTNIIEYVYKDYKERIIRINNTEKENIINKMVLDYNNYYTDRNYQLFRVTINFDNIDNLESYSRDYSSYQIIGDEE